MSDLTDRAKQALELWDKTTGVEITVFTGMVDAEAAYYAAPELVRDLLAEIVRLTPFSRCPRCASTNTRAIDHFDEPSIVCDECRYGT